MSVGGAAVVLFRSRCVLRVVKAGQTITMTLALAAGVPVTRPKAASNPAGSTGLEI